MSVETFFQGSAGLLTFQSDLPDLLEQLHLDDAFKDGGCGSSSVISHVFHIPVASFSFILTPLCPINLPACYIIGGSWQPWTKTEDTFMQSRPPPPHDDKRKLRRGRQEAKRKVRNTTGTDGRIFTNSRILSSIGWTAHALSSSLAVAPDVYVVLSQ